MGKLIKKILRESSELDWVKNVGQNKMLTINKLKELFKKNNIDVDWDIEYDRSADGHGEYNEYFGKFYYDRENPIAYNESYFIELYEKENGHLFFQLYRYDEEDNFYHRDEVYSHIETSSKNPEKFWRTVGWLVLYQMGKIKPGGGVETFNVENTIEESDDFDWVRDTPSNQKVKPWDGNIGYPTTNKTSPKYGKVYLYTDNEGVTREIKVDGLQAKHRTKNYKGEWFSSDGEVSFYDASIMDSDIQSKNYDPEYPDPYEDKYQIIMSRQEYNDNALKGKLILTPNSNTVNESEGDFDWASDINWSKEMLDSMLSDCKTLRVANFNITGNQPYSSAGGPSIMFLSRCKEWWDYFSSLPLSDSGRGPAEWFTEDNYEDGEYGVIWNSGWSRKKITPQVGDLKDGYTSAITTGWGYGIERHLNGTSTSEAWFIVDENNRPVYNLIPNNVKGYAKIYEEEFFGDKLNESKEDDFDWVRNEPLNMNVCEAYHILNPGDEIIIDAIDNWEDNTNQWDDDDWSYDIQTFYSVKAKVLALDECNNIHRGNESNARTILVSIEKDGYYGFDDRWVEDFTGTLPSQCQRDNCMFLICDKNQEEYQIKLIKKSLNESEDLEWIKNINPQGFEKSKSYVVDVSDLRPDTPISVSPTSEEYNKLTKVDVLDKLKRLGYNINEIPISEADYLYIEPYDGAGYWDDTIWVSQTHWVDYDMEHNTADPTYNGKYEIIDVNDLMFLLDNKMISESKTITEAAGISFEARKWGEIIYNEITNNPNEKKRLIIDGYDHPEAFDGFPIDYVVVDFYDRLTGYGQEHSGYDKDGNYVVLLYVQPRLVQGQGGYDLRSVLNHEMKHAWEDYNRLSKGLPSIEQTKESQELYNRDFILMLSDQNIRGPIKEILKYYYYLSDLEKSAYLENVYDQNKVYERVLRDITGKDFNEFKDRFDLDINWHLMNTAYDIPFLKKFKSPIDFIDYSAEELRSKALKMIKKVNKMRYIHKK